MPTVSATPPAPRSGSNSNWVFVAIVTGIILVALWAIRSILLLTFTAVILVIFFSIPIRRLQLLTFPGGRKISRPTAIALTLLGVVLLLILLSLMVFPQVFQQFGSLFSETIPAGIERFVDWWDNGRVLYNIPFLRNFDLSDVVGTTTPRTPGIVGLGTLGITHVPDWDNAAAPLRIDQVALQNAGTQLLAALGQVGGTVLPLLGGVANMLLSGLIVLFISLYFLAEPHRYVERIILYTPVWYRPRMRIILDRIDEAIRAWLKITGVSMLVAGVLTGLLLWIIAGLETQWLALGTIAGLASFIPNFGPIIALIPAVLVGAVVAPQNIGWIILIVYGVSFIQSQIVSPIMANEDMKMPPVLILVGQIVFGIFFGFLGLMFAVPMTAIFLVLMDEIYVKDVLGDKQSVPDENVVEPVGITG